MPKRNVTNWAEQVAEDLANQLLAAVRGVPEADAPMGAVKLSQSEQLAQFARIRSDPQAWKQMAQDNGATMEQMVDYDVLMERRYRAQMERGDARADTAERGAAMADESARGMVQQPAGQPEPAGSGAEFPDANA